MWEPVLSIPRTSNSLLCSKGPSALSLLHPWKPLFLLMGSHGFVPCVLVCTLFSLAYWSWIPVFLLTFLLFSNETKIIHLRHDYLDKDSWRRPDILNGQGNIMCPSKFPFRSSLLTSTWSQMSTRQWPESPPWKGKYTGNQRKKIRAKITSWLQTWDISSILVLTLGITYFVNIYQLALFTVFF